MTGRPSASRRVVVITGASSGIGRCTAALFARRGWDVGLIARGEAGLDAARRDVEASGARACTAAADVSDAGALERAADAIERALGPIEAWVNCAGNGVFGTFMQVTPEEFRRVTDVTYLGTVNGTRTALKRMLPRGIGTVVNLCSAVAFHGLPLLSSYSGAKCAVRGFTEALQAELAGESSRVRLAIVYPPAVNTPFFSHAASHLARPPRPCRPVYQPEIVADGIHLAATSRRREVKVGGITVLFALGTRLVPRVVTRLIGRLGYEGQTTDLPEAMRLRDPTLFAPSSNPSSIHGPFGREAFRRSIQMWASRHRRAVLGGGFANWASARWRSARR